MFFSNTWPDVLAKKLTNYFGNIWFFCALLIFVAGWMFLNSGIVSGMSIIDEYPFILLVMCVQLFEVFLSVIVLINQNREGAIAEVRTQMDFEINVQAEREITKILHMLEEVHLHLDIAKKDAELEVMKEKIDIEKIKEEIEQHIEEERKISGDTV